MQTVVEHYRTHLAPVYAWMAGGVDTAIMRGNEEIAAVLPDLSAGSFAVDLGAGFGMHAVPLARRGCTVLALDGSDLLLEELRRQAPRLPIRTVVDDLLSFAQYLDATPDAILVMGDTLTHLPDRPAVQHLFERAAQALRSGGRFITSFRDYSVALAGPARFIPVRNDADRILSCFLEYGPLSIDVHDILQERTGTTWDLRVSAYRKLRLPPQWVVDALRATGFQVRVETGLGGMVRCCAVRE